MVNRAVAACHVDQAPVRRLSPFSCGRSMCDSRIATISLRTTWKNGSEKSWRTRARRALSSTESVSTRWTPLRRRSMSVFERLLQCFSAHLNGTGSAI